MGWAMLIALAAFAGALFALIRFPRRLWTIPATALTLAAAGYTWQGSPGLEGHPVANEKQRAEVDPRLTELRDSFFGRFGFDSQYFGAADAMTRNGSPELAAKTMIGAVAKAPTDAALWAWLGVTLVASDNGALMPSSRYAFDRAIQLAPQHPGPPFFLGLALISSGQAAEGRKYWARAVELAPEKASYRERLVAQLAALDQALAAQGASPAP